MITKKIVILIVVLLSFNIFAENDISQITVTGKSRILVIPDKIILHLKILTSDKQLEIARNKNTDITQEIFKVLKKFKIKKKNIQTSYLKMTPAYSYDNGRLRSEKLIGYNVDNKLIVVLEKLENLENLVSKLLNAKVTSIENIIFHSSKLDSHKKDARKMAIVAAKEKAIYLAEELNLKIGKAIRIEEKNSSFRKSNYYPNPFNSQTSVKSYSNFSSNEISLGEISINAEIKISFELK